MPKQFDTGKQASVDPYLFSKTSEKLPAFLGESVESKKINDNRFIDSEGLEYFFTKDQNLLNEYIKTRQAVYASDLGLDGLLGQKDEFDDLSRNHSLVLLKNGKCVGGGRITICNDYKKELLPMENNEFSLFKSNQNLELYKNKYAEVSRLFVMKEERSARIAGNLYVMMNIKASEFNTKYVFIQAPRIQARSYKIICNRLNIKTTIRDEINVPRQDYHGNLDKIQVAVFTVNPLVDEIVK